MSNLLALRNGVVNAMRALTGANERFEGVTISPHGGDFDTKRELELRKLTLALLGSRAP